jgi:hypothetical protein
MAVVWTLLIMVLCWLPRTLVDEVEHESTWFKLPYLDKIIHCGIFVVFSILWLRVRSFRGRVASVALFGFALGALTEIVQSLPRRDRCRHRHRGRALHRAGGKFPRGPPFPCAEGRVHSRRKGGSRSRCPAVTSLFSQ